MSEKDNGMADRPVKAKVVKVLTPIEPPGTVLMPGMHGPQKTVKRLVGSALLRQALKLSMDVPIETVCGEAARELEALRSGKKTK